MSYIGNEPIVSATRTITEIVATAGQTVFVANGGYTVGFIDVFVNGAQLQTNDFTATNGSTITLVSPASTGDDIRLVAWGTFQTSSALTANNPSYTGTLTGGTSVVNIGSGQVYKDASGNVGIGTASPQTNSLTISKGIGNGTISGQSPTAPTAADQRLFLVGFGSDADPYKARISAFSDAAWTAGTSTPTYLNFSTTPLGSATAVERLRIESDGTVLINTTSKLSSGSSGMTLVGVAGTSGSIFDIQHNGNPAAGRDFIRFYNLAGGEAGSIEHNGTSTVAYLTSSDYRLKENILPMVGGLDKVMCLKPVTYTWKEDKKDWQGFIAHELQEVVPECVSGTKDAVDEEGKPVYQGIDTSFLVATLTAAIQELKASHDALNAKVEAQAAEIQALKQGGV